MSWCYCKKKNAKKMHVKPQRLTASPHCKGEEKQPVQLKCFLIASIALKKQRGKDPVSIACYKRQIQQKTEGERKQLVSVFHQSVYYYQSSPNTCHIHPLYLHPGHPKKRD